MDIVGYTDRLSVQPGDPLRIMVSCGKGEYRAGVVRLRHGDLNPKGPGFLAAPVASAIDGAHPGRHQPIHPGSYIRIEKDGPLAGLGSFTLAAWVHVNQLPGRDQAIVTKFCAETGEGFGLALSADARLELRLGQRRIVGKVPVRGGHWYFLAAAFDQGAGRATLYHRAKRPWIEEEASDLQIESLGRVQLAPARVATLIAASHLRPDEASAAIGDFFNGKIDNPRIFATALAPSRLAALAAGGSPEPADRLVADWNFSQRIAGAAIEDLSGSGLGGTAINAPTRAVTGHNWTGRVVDFTKAPAEYGAIHFHDDDLEDAGWQADMELVIPADWRSGVYAIRLEAAGFEDYLPFVVRPARGAAKAKVALLLPTLTYLAYANDHMPTEPGLLLSRLNIGLDAFLATYATAYESSVFRYMVDERLHSLYDFHSDGSPVCIGSRLRPLTNIRPRYNKPNIRFRYPHLLPCDLYIVDWLEAKGFDYDVIDDESLHAEGQSLLDGYKAVLTGTHPEYWTYAMLQALDGYLANSGRFIYLGGNGFYWVTSIDAERPHLIEIRRGLTGLRTWTSPPGEYHHAMTGEFGGLWRNRGIVPQALVGVGFTAACGLEPARPYKRTAASRDPALAFIFEGVEEAAIGDYGLHMEGAAGWEIDRADPALGTPPNAAVVASSYGHTDAYQRAIEELTDLDPATQGGTGSALVRADLTYFERPGGGAVFSVGSMSWCGCFSHNNYANGVSRITENVLRRFIG